MFNFWKGEKKYFVNYTIQKSQQEYGLNHCTITIDYRKSTDHLGDVVKHLAKKHDCSPKQIVVNAFNEI